MWQYNVIGDENPGKNLNAFKKIRTAFETGDPSALNTEERGYHDRILTWRNDKNPDGWTQDRIFGEKSSFAVIEQYVNSGNYITNKFYGPPLRFHEQVHVHPGGHGSRDLHQHHHGRGHQRL